jgi:uroporphyrinogen-III synthase
VKKLTKLGIECIELPLIEHAPAEDRALLGSTLAAGGWDWVIATSPEGAKVLLEGVCRIQRALTTYTIFAYIVRHVLTTLSIFYQDYLLPP